MISMVALSDHVQSPKQFIIPETRLLCTDTYRLMGPKVASE